MGMTPSALTIRQLAKNQYGGPIIDQWTYYDYKSTFSGTGVSTMGMGLAPVWVPSWHRRRLQAYKLLESYYRNSAREWLDASIVDEKDKMARREYGDPEVLTEAALASLIGSDQSIVVPDADQENPDDGGPATDELEVLLAWAEQERFMQKIIEMERTTIRLGDGCLVLGWDEAKGRPRLNVYDPGFYFPVLDEEDMSDEDYPRTVHIAYEYETHVDGRLRRYIRKMTWRLGPIGMHDASGYSVQDAAMGILFESEQLTDTGEITRLYPWNTDPVSETCYYSDAVWELSQSVTFLQDLDVSNADVRAYNVDLQIDFIPVVHVPNTVSWKEHYGVPTIARVMQLLDDVISTDTDLQASSAITGTPPIAVSGAVLPKDSDGKVKTYGPGTLWETGDGNATMIDTSTSLDALLKYKDALLERLAVNSRTPEGLLGRIKPSEVPSGIALALSFSPHSNMIREMRLVRKDKYRLLLKFVVRYFMLNGDLLDYHPAELRFGSYLPADRQEVASIVQQLLTVKAISLDTAVSLLVEAGFPIESQAAEVQNIQENDFAGANDLLNAVGDVQVVRDRLGLGPAQPLDLSGLSDALGTLNPPPPNQLPPAQ
jgi:hypothetical protein